MNTESPKTKRPRSAKAKRLNQVLIGLVDHYIQTANPVGSSTLKQAEFKTLSAATLRNYFAELESKGYLRQLHASGGRIPTEKGYRAYANEMLRSSATNTTPEVEFPPLEKRQTREVARYLQESADRLSNVTNTAVFLSAPRFDHDYVIDIKVVTLDQKRCLAVLITDFGVIQTAVLHSQTKLTSFSAKRLEDYFLWRLTGKEKSKNLEPEEEALAKEFYNEVMVRYIVSYSNFTDEDVYRTGFAKLLNYPEYSKNTQELASSMALFENIQGMRLLLRECSSTDQMRVWVGNDLVTYSKHPVETAVLATSYHIHQARAGAIGLLGPLRLPYRELFSILRRFAFDISEALTHSVYKFKIQYRKPEDQTLCLPESETLLLEQPSKILLEDKNR